MGKKRKSYKKAKNNKYDNLSKPDAEFDFHGRGILRDSDVRQLADDFLVECRDRGLKKILFITGKGLHSREGMPKIKPYLRKYLLSLPFVVRVYEGRRDRGGTGTLEVVLKKLDIYFICVIFALINPYLMFKRFLSIFLVVVMVFLNLSSTVFAATGDITTWFVDGPDNIVSSSDMATPDIVNLTGDMYVIVYDTTVSGSGGPGSSGLPRMLSIEIQSNGTLGAVLDDVDLETGINDTYWPGKPRILAVDDDTVVVVMQNRANNVVAVTADIAGDGTITPLNFLKLHDYGSEDPALIHVSGDVYATAYMWEETPYRALLHTFSVTSAGAISSLNTLTFDTRVSTETFNNFDIVQVSGDVYAIVYLENSSPDNGIIETVSISSDGLTLSTIDSYSFASATGITEPEILSVGGGYYAVVYGYNVDGYLETYQIDNSGNITKTGYIDQLIFETGHLYTPDFDYIGEDVYAITYYDTNPNIKVATVQIESSGAIGDVLIDSEVQDVDPADELYPQPELINVDGSVYALTFVGNNDKDGFLATLEIDSGLSAPIPEYRVWIYVIALVLGFALIWQGQRRFVKT